MYMYAFISYMYMDYNVVKCICFCGNHSPSSLLSKLVYQDSYNTIYYIPRYKYSIDFYQKVEKKFTPFYHILVLMYYKLLHLGNNITFVS